MELLKLIALDKEDLSIVSAYMQDAVFKSGDLDYRAKEKRFLLVGNRFVWEDAQGRRKRSFERRRTALHLTGSARCVRAASSARLTIPFCRC